MRASIFALAAPLVMAGLMTGCSSVPTQPAPSEAAFQTKFLNLASITDQIGNMTNIGVNTQVNVPIQVAPITQISALSYGDQSAIPGLSQGVTQGLNFNVDQLLDQFAASL